MSGIKYRHITYIPAKGSAKLVIFDLFKVNLENNGKKEEFYLIKVHSEYGVGPYPRVCLKLLKDKPFKGEIVFKFVVAGDNTKEPAFTEVKIKYDQSKNDYVLFYRNKDEEFSKILQNVKALKFVKT